MLPLDGPSLQDVVTRYGGRTLATRGVLKESGTAEYCLLCTSALVADHVDSVNNGRAQQVRVSRLSRHRWTAIDARSDTSGEIQGKLLPSCTTPQANVLDPLSSPQAEQRASGGHHDAEPIHARGLGAVRTPRRSSTWVMSPGETTPITTPASTTKARPSAQPSN